MELNINDFSGPLDLLLYMVKHHQMDIYDINIHVIIDEYINFINKLEKFDLDSKSEYLIMASELIHLKSKMLLGFDDGTDDDEAYEINSEEDLKNKIIEYEKYQNLSETFKELESNRSLYFTKTPEKIEMPQENSEASEKVDVSRLIDAFLDIQKRLEYKKPKITKITRKELNIRDKTEYIKNILKTKSKIEFSELIDNVTKEEFVVTLLSILELSKSREITISQTGNFNNIYIEVRYE